MQPTSYPSGVRRPARTIGGKLNRLVVLSVGTALLIGAALSGWQGTTEFLRAKQTTLLATANVFASATSRAVAGGDALTVMQAIRAVARVPGLIFANVRTLDGRTLAEIGSGARLSNDLALSANEALSPLALLSTRTLTVTVAIVNDAKTVGEIELVSDVEGLGEQLQTFLTHALLGLAVATAVGLISALRLRRSITRPLETLAEAMVAFGHGKEGSLSLPTDGDAETAVLADRFNMMVADIRAATNRILDREEEIIARLSKAGEMRDDQTGQHVVRVAKISRIIATELGLPRTFVDDLCRASPMHDVGKIAISDAILHKPGRLDADERREMEEHARRGHSILDGSKSELVQLAAEIAISHHERWDGKGYPNRIAGVAIPLSGRITAVADVCDALLSERPYKKPWSLAQVRELLATEAGAHFDPDCVDALLTRWADLTKVYPDVADEALERAA